MYKPFYMALRKPGFGQFNFILENDNFKSMILVKIRKPLKFIL